MHPKGQVILSSIGLVLAVAVIQLSVAVWQIDFTHIGQFYFEGNTLALLGSGLFAVGCGVLLVVALAGFVFTAFYDRIFPYG